jgi:PPOX class probable F420-dependent enzyme
MIRRPDGAHLAAQSPGFRAFWTERHLVTLCTLRQSGTPHLVPVGATIDWDADLVRVICSRGSQKARNIMNAHRAGIPALAAVCQIDGRRWSSVEGLARVSAEPADVSQAERRYAERYRPPRVNPERVVIEIAVNRVLGNV